MEDILVAVDVPLVGDERHKNWAKVVANVDPSKPQAGRTKATSSPPVASKTSLQDRSCSSTASEGVAPTLLLRLAVYTANADGTLSPEARASGRAWARTLRDNVQDLLHRGTPIPHELDWSPSLMQYSDEAIREEVRRRRLDTERS